MSSRGVAGVAPLVRRPVVAAAVVVVLVVATLVAVLSVRARGAAPDRCARFAAGSTVRAGEVTGSGDRVVVIGDSWSAGLGLANTAQSWPSRLPGSVHVAGFSGSGFSEHAIDCGPVSFADRAPAAVRDGAALVVVEGGLNDYNQPGADIRAGFARLMRELDGQRVVVVGPASAPSRADGVPRVDALLARLSGRHDVPYVRTSGLQLPYLPDHLHLTPAGHQEFGDFVARAIAALG